MRFYKTMLLKAYFDKGYSVTSYIKYLIAYYGLVNRDSNLMLIAAIYGVACFFIGWLWYKYKIVDAEIEVGNRVNPFVKEMRRMSGAIHTEN